MEPKTEEPELLMSIDVWQRRSSTELFRYRRFKSLPTVKYAVQSEDHYHLPLGGKQIADLDKQYLELLIEQSPSERAGVFDSLLDARQAHIESFTDF